MKNEDLDFILNAMYKTIKKIKIDIGYSNIK